MCRRKLCRHVFMLPTQNSSLACTTKMKPRGNKIVFLCMTSSGSNWNNRWRKSIGLHGKNQEWFLGERNPVSTIKTYFLLIDQVLCFMLDGKWFMHHSVCHSETPNQCTSNRVSFCVFSGVSYMLHGGAVGMSLTMLFLKTEVKTP